MSRAAAGATADLRRVVRDAIVGEARLERGDGLVVGFSGGPDSLALLHALVSLSAELGLRLLAAHLNHGLRGEESDADAEFASAICEQWQVPLTVAHRDVAALGREMGLAIEEAARQVRYGFLAGVAEKLGAAAVAVGHNADDQVETVLMHFLRGAGTGGLRGMLPVQRLADLHLDWEGSLAPSLMLIRPLLRLPRARIEAYCRDHDLAPRFDRSNLDRTYFRNRLRHELIPCLESYNLSVRAVVRRMAEVLAADHDYLLGEVEQTWKEVVLGEERRRIVFALQGFRRLHLSLQRGIIRRAIAALRPPLRNIDLIHVEQAVAVLHEARGAGAKVTLPDGLLLTVGYERFAIADQAEASAFEGDYPQLPAGVAELAVPVPGDVELPGGWRLDLAIKPRTALPAEDLAGAHPWRAYLDAGTCVGPLVLRPRCEGERLQPLGLGGRGKKLGELMINEKIPAAYRERYPLLACAGRPLWLPGFRLDHRARVTEATTSVLVASLSKT